MTGKDVLEYLQKLPLDILNGNIVIADCIQPLTEDLYSIKHDPICTIMVDTRTNEIVLFNEENRDKFDKLAMEDQ